MENTLNSSLNKLFLAGIGAICITGEKSKELFDQLATKGEAAIQQAKTVNEELRHNKGPQEPAEVAYSDILQKLDSLSKEEIAGLQSKLAELSSLV